MFFLLYGHTDDGVIDDFPQIFDHFPNDLSEVRTNVAGHFPKTSENYRRFPRIAEDFRGRPEDISIIHH